LRNFYKEDLAMNATTTDSSSNVTNDIERLKTVLNHNPDDIAAVVSLGNI